MRLGTAVILLYQLKRVIIVFLWVFSCGWSEIYLIRNTECFNYYIIYRLLEARYVKFAGCISPSILVL
uniref:Uncharacterized protein n=1 Tax=Salix viminalis TaxID=40686 RepID=A0A6N2LN25_SALVM